MPGTAWMRNAVTGDKTPLNLLDVKGPLATIDVPAFGAVMIAELPTNEPIVRLAQPPVRALLAMGRERGEKELKPRRVGDLIEVELLDNGRGDDRLVVTWSPIDNDPRSVG